METKEKTEEQKTTGLMRQTKAQLIEIILRKDAVEKELREEAKQNNKLIDKIKHSNLSLEKDNTTLANRIGELRKDYADMCDEFASERQTLRDKVTKYKTLLMIASVIILFLIGGICSLLIY